ncbi:MAG TPA: hypothetical protein VGW10_11185 [Solirubrobacteraceae bacterium]|nr:hypothetical protein [Solirubrobacteraceae bacterium]
MEGKISVIGDVPVSATLAEGARGADVLVAAANADVLPAARLAPAAVLLIVDGSSDDVARALDATLWPGQRVVGVRSGDVAGAVRAVAGEGEARLRGVLRDGEVDVTLGRGGVRLAKNPG